ncbi:MAG: hypothetical protein P8N76_24035 [Pirellulaceae bacterium]|nr:hypothetical protein [Pirellulaceae bacterium]
MMGITVSDCGKNVARSIGPELQSAILDTEDCDQGNSVSRLLYDYEAVQLEQASFLNKVRFTASPSGIVYRERYEAPVYHLGTLRGDFIAFALRSA